MQEGHCTDIEEVATEATVLRNMTEKLLIVCAKAIANKEAKLDLQWSQIGSGKMSKYCSLV